ncbi:protein Tat [Roseibium sp. TrichSKD4]|nr:protein Tat [Roseibium sp. TrichSKD4]
MTGSMKRSRSQSKNSGQIDIPFQPLAVTIAKETGRREVKSALNALTLNVLPDGARVRSRTFA